MSARFVLGEPEKLYEYNGRILKLYSPKTIQRVIHRGHEAYRRAEKRGYLPPPMFRYKQYKYYSGQEVMALADLVSEMGVPRRFGKYGTDRWVKELHRRWAEVRKALVEGSALPDQPIILRFEKREELFNILKSRLREAGIDSNRFIDTLIEDFMAFSAL